MPNAIKWDATLSLITGINGDGTSPTLKGLANNAQKLGSVYDNATELNQFADFELLVRGASAFTAGGYVELYLIPSADGTNYADGDDSIVPSPDLMVGMKTVRAVSTQQRLYFRRVELPPVKFKPLIINKTGQAFTNTDSENVLKFGTYNNEIQ